MTRAFALAVGNGRHSKVVDTQDPASPPLAARTSWAPYRIEDPQSSSLMDRPLAADKRYHALAQVDFAI